MCDGNAIGWKQPGAPNHFVKTEKTMSKSMVSIHSQEQAPVVLGSLLFVMAAWPSLTDNRSLINVTRDPIIL